MTGQRHNRIVEMAPTLLPSNATFLGRVTDVGQWQGRWYRAPTIYGRLLGWQNSEDKILPTILSTCPRIWKLTVQRILPIVFTTNKYCSLPIKYTYFTWYVKLFAKF